ncbi:hypothetical protein NQ318_013405 [Aromia moschata]|uniref:Uncharacterized protein n=1 Tax=Aromia moschata TaxID=1265417 RepID=A0AAV8YP39_9CUCU|nr:hypothetical protein NQ318_013405 [Aromia moschata]
MLCRSPPGAPTPTAARPGTPGPAREWAPRHPSLALSFRVHVVRHAERASGCRRSVTAGSVHVIAARRGCECLATPESRFCRRYLDRWEKVHYLHEEADRGSDDDEESRHKRWSARALHSVPYTYNYGQHNVTAKPLIQSTFCKILQPKGL